MHHNGSIFRSRPAFPRRGKYLPAAGEAHLPRPNGSYGFGGAASRLRSDTRGLRGARANSMS